MGEWDPILGRNPPQTGSSVARPSFRRPRLGRNCMKRPLFAAPSHAGRKSRLIFPSAVELHQRCTGLGLELHALAAESWGSASATDTQKPTHTLPVVGNAARGRQPRLGPGLLALVGPMECPQKRRSGSLRQSPPISAQLISWGVSWKPSSRAGGHFRVREGDPVGDGRCWAKHAPKHAPRSGSPSAVTFLILFLGLLIFSGAAPDAGPNGGTQDPPEPQPSAQSR